MTGGGPEVPQENARGWRWPRRHPKWALAAMVTAFFSVSLYGGIVAYDNLSIVTAHAYDLAIFQQAFSSSAQGFRIPFYESTDCLAKSRCSFLLVHPSLVLYPLVPIYALAPSAFTLFALRSLIVGAAAIPLYFLARRVNGSTGKGLLAAGLYLVWAPTLAGDLFSFHVESFLPLEFFTLVALWEARRYRLALLVAVLSFVTIEIAPVFAFLVAVFFLVPFASPVLRAARSAARAAAGRGAALRAWFVSLLRSLRASFRDPRTRPALALAALSLVAYFALTVFMNVLGAHLLGLPAPNEPGGASDLLFNNSSGPVYTSVSKALTSTAFRQTIAFWLILYALLAFLPLLAPRALVLSVPWIVLTFLSADHRFSGIGSQYTMVAAVPLFLGLAYGLQRVPLGPRDRPDLASEPVATPPAPPELRLRERRRNASIWAGALGAVVIVNLLLSPMSPLIPATIGTLPSPFFPDYFEPSLTIEPGIQWVDELVAEIPPHATVGAANNLYPLVAGDIEAYRLTGESLARLPFNYTGGPAYVLSTDPAVSQGGANLTAALGDPSEYGLRGYVERTADGPVVLYEKGFTGSPELFGPAVAPATLTFAPGDGLHVGHSGTEESNATAPGGVDIANNFQRDETGRVCNATVGFLPAGNYTLEFSIQLTRLNRSASNHSVGATVIVQGVGSPLFEENFTGAVANASAWNVVAVNVDVRAVAVDVGFELEWRNTRFSVAIAGVDWVAG